MSAPETPRTWTLGDILRSVHRNPRDRAGEIEIRYEVPYILDQSRLGVIIQYRHPEAPNVLIGAASAHGFGGNPPCVENLGRALILAAGEVRAINTALDEGYEYDPDSCKSPVDAEREQTQRELARWQGRAELAEEES